MTHEQLKTILFNKRVIIIGRAAYLLHQENGEFIDSHDVVVRVNRPYPHHSEKTPGRHVNFVDRYYQHILGVKTHLMFFNAYAHQTTGPSINLFIKDGGLVVIAADMNKKNQERYGSYRDNVQKVAPYHIISNNFQKTFSDEHFKIGGYKTAKDGKQQRKVNAFSGLNSIKYLLTFDIKQLTAVGFSCAFDDDDYYQRMSKHDFHSPDIDLYWLYSRTLSDKRLRVDNTIAKIFDEQQSVFNKIEKQIKQRQSDDIRRS